MGRTIQHLLIVCSAGLSLACSSGHQSAAGEYALVDFKGDGVTLKAGERGTYGSLVLHDGGKLTGETRLEDDHDKWDGSWAISEGKLQLFVGRRTIQATTSRSGELAFTYDTMMDGPFTWRWRRVVD